MSFRFHKVCPYCKRTFAFEKPDQIFCSYECEQHKNGNFASGRRQPKVRVCTTCRKEFQRLGNSNYCSDQCRNFIRDRNKTKRKEKLRLESINKPKKENKKKKSYETLNAIAEKKCLEEEKNGYLVSDMLVGI